MVLGTDTCDLVAGINKVCLRVPVCERNIGWAEMNSQNKENNNNMK